MPTKPTKDHSGHRQRLRKQFLDGGLTGISDAQALELLLCYAIPRQDVAALAGMLLARFGSYRGVLRAPVAELMQVSGVSEHTAALLALVNQNIQRYSMPSLLRMSQRELRDYLTVQIEPFFSGRRDEMMYLMGLDDIGKVIHAQLLSEGEQETTDFSMRQVVGAAIHMNVNMVLVAHNHPTGMLYPSQWDVDATAQMRAALDAVNILLLDHIIFTDSGWLSVREFSAENS